MRDIRAEIDTINDVVSLPTVLTEIMSELGKEDAVIPRITKLIETDPVLTGSVLRVVNSPFFGLRWRVTNVANAIGLLGLIETSKLLTAVYLKQRLFTLSQGQEEYLSLLWNHSIHTASLAQLIVREFGVSTGGKEFTAGLLHDMGKIVLAEYYPTELDMVHRMVRELEQNDVQAETQVLALSHTEIGGMLGERWQLPLDYIETLTFHHTPSQASVNPELAAVVRFADLVAEHLGYGINEQAKSSLFIDDESFPLLTQQESSLKGQTLPEILDRLAAKHEEESQFIGLF